MVKDESALGSVQQVLDASTSAGGTSGDVLGSRVLTDTGPRQGRDVLLEMGGGRDAPCDVVGYEIEASESLGEGGSRLLIPPPGHDLCLR